MTLRNEDRYEMENGLFVHAFWFARFYLRLRDVS